MNKTFAIDTEGTMVTIGDDQWKGSVLSMDPFEGDMDEGTDLSDTIVKCRGSKALCNTCLGICAKGTYNRVIKTAIDGTVLSNRFCEECCTSMAYGDILIEGNIFLDVDDDEAYEAACVLIPGTENDYFDPPFLEEQTYIRRENNEHVLVTKYGNNYSRRPKEDLFKLMEKEYNASRV